MSAVPPELLAQLMSGGGPPGMGGPPPPPPGGPPGLPPDGGIPGIQPEPQAPMQPQPPEWDKFDVESMVIPVRFSVEGESRLKEFLHDEIERAARFAQNIHKEIHELREQYAESRKPKNFPFEKCSNYAVPMTQPAVNNIAGRNIRSLCATSPLVMIEPLPGVEDMFSDPELINGMQDFLNARMMVEPRFYQAAVEWIFETTILGTGVVKHFWDREERKIRNYTLDVDPMTGRSAPRIVDTEVCDFEGTKIELLRLEDVLFPPEVWNNSNFINDAQWFSQRWRIRWPQLEALCSEGKFGWIPDDLEQLRGEADQTDFVQQSTYIDPKTRKSGDIQDPGHDSANELLLYNVSIKWPVEEGGEEEEIEVVYSYRKNVLLRAIKNPNFHGKRPYTRMLYLPLPNSAYGRGVCELLKNPQAMANDLWNSANDALTLANTGFYVAGKETGIKPGKNDRLWVGKIAVFDQPDSIRRMDTISPSPMSTEFMAQIDQMSQRASGVSNSGMGGEGVSGNRETAQSVMQRTGSQTPVFDVVLDQIRHPFAEIAEIILINFQQYAPKGQEYFSSSASGQAIKKFLKLPIESIVGKYKFNVVVSTASANNETKKLTLVDLSQTIKPMLQNMGELAAAMSKPDMPPASAEIARHDLQTSLAIARQICQTYELPGADTLLPPWEEFWATIGPMIDQAKQQAAQQPPPLDPTVERHMFPAFQQLMASEAIQVLGKAGLTPDPERQALANGAAQSRAGGGPMGQPGPEGQGGMPGAPGEMPGLPMPPGGPQGQPPSGP